MKKKQIFTIVYWLLFFGAFWFVQHYTPLGHYMTLSYMQEKSAYFKALVERNYLLAVIVYCAMFVATMIFSLPTSILLTLLGGYMFGAVAGTLYATMCVTIGVGSAYLGYRFFLSDMLRENYAVRAARFEKAMKDYGVSYLLMLHFSTIFPYFVINSLAALSNVSFWTVLWTTALGFFPQGFIYALAGRELATIDSVSDIFSTEIIIVFILLIMLACVPIVMKKRKKSLSLDETSQ